MVHLHRTCLSIVVAVILSLSLASDANAVYRQYAFKESPAGYDVSTIALEIFAAIFVIVAYFYGVHSSNPPSVRTGIILASSTAGVLFGTQLLFFF